ncbi:hypothetical protein P691DRAFT_766842 [Macrolepiota fuliginosa MF-IS2]|uniref:Uncharacterized protein n=1 Tax=Macrolepiota fuliginosa MF-IS2 TaxID=1400762 RepID=A0A9P5X0D3_9AGAR|nr:hypothetical protein P691DRAFT_766842 [Macrolepiota fuliginosa MF-IS2]
MKIGGFDWTEIRNDLFKMNFTEVDASTQDNSAAIEIDNNDNALSYKELSPAGELANAITAFRQWFKNNNIADNECPGLIDNIRHLAMMFSLIPAPHHCPTPPLCICPHQDNALPCRRLHTDDIPPPLPLLSTVPSTSDLDIIKATLSGGLIGACVCIPASQSFIKIVDVPFYKPGTTEPFTSAEVDTQLQRSIIPSDYVVYWHYICNSPKADSATIWINLAEALIKGAKAHTVATRCPICAGPHVEANHQSLAGCCCSNPKASPPTLPTPAGKPACTPAHASTVVINLLQMIGAAHIGATTSTRPSLRNGLSGMPWSARVFPLPHLPHMAPAQHLATDDDEMELFGLELDDDYPFHK